jgi:hypothetical protein
VHYGEAFVRGLGENFDRELAAAKACECALLDTARDPPESVRAAEAAEEDAMAGVHEAGLTTFSANQNARQTYYTVMEKEARWRI